ncbi:D-alanine--D-alanine ligase [Psychrosphaera sp.]|nr:D-alanine--D-alanine ligase [Psychrosphaera sp.]
MTSTIVAQLGKVAVMFGGTSAEREVSINSGKAVLAALEDAGVDAHGFDPKFDYLDDLLKKDFDRVFIVLHGRGGEDGSLQGALKLMGLPFTGSGPQGSAFAMDKVRSKYLFKGAELPSAPFAVVKQGKPYDTKEILDSLSGRVMVKPANEGSSIGMSQASTPEELNSAIRTAFEFDKDVLIEQWVVGREVTATIVGGQAMPLIEMRTPNEFYDYEAKYKSTNTEYLCPAPLSNELTARIQELAVEAFDLVGASGWGRVDFLLDDNEQPYLLEINTVPGMTTSSLVPKSAAQFGMSFNDLVMSILLQTLTPKNGANETGK